MAANVNKWSETPASNATADPAINWAEGQAPSTVNDSARQMMAAVAANRDDTQGALTFGGTSAALTLATNSVNATYQNGLRVSGKLASAFTAGATLNVDSVGAKNIYRITGSGAAAIQPSDGAAGQHVIFQYDTSLNASVGGWVFLGEAQGRLINTQVFAASGTYTKTPGATTAIVLAQAGGGAGGGANVTTAGNISFGGHGGSGSWAFLYNWTIVSPQTVTIGAGGVGGAGTGGTGGATTFGAIISTSGASGGAVTGSTPIASTATVFGGGGGAVATGGTVNSNGQAPGTPLLMNSTFYPGTGGAPSSCGGGAPGRSGSSAGATATSPGSGGGGALSANAAAANGGNGAPGIVIVWEYT